MKISFVSVVTTLVTVAQAHTYLSHLTIAGTRHPEGECLEPYPKLRNRPVLFVDSSDLTCGLNRTKSASVKSCPVQAGTDVIAEWHHNNDSPSDDVISASHKGPCIFYMAPAASDGKGDVWFKIFEDGYDPSTKTWCINKLRDNKGKIAVKIPPSLKPGDYLLRGEVIALHNADAIHTENPKRGAQFYVHCGHITVTGGGSEVPKGHAIPGVYKYTDPGVHFNVHKPFSEYVIPGPPVCAGGTSNSKGTTGQTKPSKSQASSAPKSTSYAASSAPAKTSGAKTKTRVKTKHSKTRNPSSYQTV
ncbi:hypothetical protein EC988_005741 [Linderina pennispora]|nr:hypothetical protein EC988_005741 [Linderina pennispora]